jgi:hypothetical protein
MKAAAAGMGMSGISASIRRGIWLGCFAWFAGFTTVRAVADETARTAGDAPVPATATQARLKEMFPETYTKAVAEYGWRQYRDGKWGVLQERLPRRMVVLVHGIDEPGKLWMNMAPAVTQAGYVVCEFRYPNDQPIRPSAAYLLHSLCDLRMHGVTAIVMVADGVGDGCVSVSSVKLEGIADFVTVSGTHLSTVRNVLESSKTVPPAVPLVLERLAKDWPLPASGRK